jgi:hypothetical protein
MWMVKSTTVRGNTGNHLKEVEKTYISFTIKSFIIIIWKEKNNTDDFLTDEESENKQKKKRQRSNFLYRKKFKFLFCFLVNEIVVKKNSIREIKLYRAIVCTEILH